MITMLSAIDVENLLDTKGHLVEIVDCRDEDRAEGWIAGSTHFPSAEQDDETMEAFINGAASRSKELLVFHCMFSQSRGPRAARIALSIVQRRGLVSPQIALMSGGWIAFRTLVSTRRPELCLLSS